MKRYRIAESPWNTDAPPWNGAIAIEDTEDGRLAVPSVVCWFTRGHADMARLVVALLNESETSQEQAQD